MYYIFKNIKKKLYYFILKKYFLKIEKQKKNYKK